MNKLKTILILGLALVFAVGISLFGCQAEPEVVTETVVETVTETVTEVVEVEAEEGAYEYYEMLKVHAQDTDDPYPDSPAEGHAIAYTDIMGGIPFCNAVYGSVQKEWELAGGAAGDLYYADNQYDATVGLQNADILLAKQPEVLIWFQFDSKVNSIVSQKYGDADIPIIAVDVASPGAPFMGVNNFQVAYMAGEKAIELVEEQGGIDTIDNIILMQMPSGGEAVMLRSEGFYQAFADTYGADVVDPITIRADGGAGEAEQANQAMADVLASVPGSENFVLTSVNEETMDGCISAVQTAGRWDPDKWIIITQGVDDVGKAQIREGLTDAGIAYFPERYGEYLVAASCAYLQGEVVPPFMYVENEVITIDNIDEWYPE